jgi:hypothetical protein
MKSKLAISNSGGLSSAFMAKMCVDKYKSTHEIVITFANTGQEHENTLAFIKQCDDHFGWNTVWLEAVVGPPGVGIRHKIITFESASRNGEPFEAYIKKHGIPNAGVNQCTSRLKTEVMDSYLRSVGFVRGKNLNYDTAIGIRADEPDRISRFAKKQRLVYPLVRAGVTKQDVLRFWRNAPFTLNLPGEHYGNCVTCWKKSYRKLMTIAKEQPHRFDFFRRMEKEHRLTKCNTENGRVFFRQNKSVEDIFEMASKPFTPYQDQKPPDMEQGTFDAAFDVGSGCSESCEIGSDE